MNNFFLLFEIPESFHPDAGVVKAAYYRLSRQYHPDRVATAPDAEKQLALDTSAQINLAFRTLCDPDAVMGYILKQHGMLADEEKYDLPPAFLREMMDLNDVLDELAPGDEAALRRATAALLEAMDSWQAQLSPLTTRFDGGEQTPELLGKIKDAYFRKKYLLRIKERIDKFATR